MKRFLLPVVIELLLLACGYAALCIFVDTDAMLPGTAVNGVNISGMTAEEAAAALEEHTERLCTSEGFTVSFGEESYTVTLPDTFTFDYQSAAENILQAEQAALPARGLAWLKSQLAGTESEVSPAATDMEHFHESIAASGLSGAVTASQKPYWIEDGEFFTADTLKSVDEAALARQITAVLKSGETKTVTECPIIYDEEAAEAMKARLFADQLASYTTKVSGSSNMVTNIMLATEKCNGTVLLPDDVFSFNDTVGEQTEATGFKTADAILNGEIIQAYGGGVCQVSTTIFAAALYANLEIVERWNHTYVSSYISAGLDAAVAWGARDFRFANDTDSPVRIDVSCVDANLTVTLWGTKADATSVEISTETLAGSAAGTLDVLTLRTVYPGDDSPSYTEEISRSSYLR